MWTFLAKTGYADSLHGTAARGANRAARTAWRRAIGAHTKDGPVLTSEVLEKKNQNVKICAILNDIFEPFRFKGHRKQLQKN